jgi:GT2 family glycosyltransferase
VVVVNYNGGELTLRCLRSLEGLAWPPDRLRIVLVDNASIDGVVERVRAELPSVEVVETGANVGFGAGCNAGIARLDDAHYVALVNNDAAVDRGWVAALVDALELASGAGAACPKILFAGRFGAVAVECPTHQRGRGDNRALGVQVSGCRVDGEDVWRETQLVSGFWGQEAGTAGQWTAARALLHVPRGSEPTTTVELCLVADDDTDVVISGGDQQVQCRVGTRPDWYEITASIPSFDVLNSAGALLVEGGYGADRGYLEPDHGQYESAEEVFGWSGAGVLLSRAYLDDVGRFHEPLFLYYEDLDLSWRGRARGWRSVYVPGAVERHVHAASSVEGSELFHHYVERNRLLVLARNASTVVARRSAVRFVLTTASYARRDCLVALRFGRAPNVDVVRCRLRAFVAFLGLLPAALRERRILRRRMTSTDDDVNRWVAAGPNPGPSVLSSGE